MPHAPHDAPHDVSRDASHDAPPDAAPDAALAAQAGSILVWPFDRPVLVLQQVAEDGPAFLATWLQTQGVAMDLRCAQAGDTLPADLRDHAALALLGGWWSANDDRAWLRASEGLVRLAVAQGVPIVGHCLGAQLMARALGGTVGASPRPEVGWQRWQVAGSAAARHWFGTSPPDRVFHWHGESFSLPAGAQLLASTAACPHQAFALGPHLAMQFHVELDAAKLQLWAADRTAEYLDQLAQYPDSVQDGMAMLAEADTALPAQQALAANLYTRWLEGCRERSV